MVESESDDGESEASLFEAISHSTRIKILYTLHESSLGFSELKHRLDIKSSGNLQHHLTKLGSLIELRGGIYSLSDDGREAVMAIDAVRRMQNRRQSDRVIITMVYGFSMYVAFMNVPFFFGTVDASTPIMALWIAVITSAILYITWPFIFSRWERKHEVTP